MATHGEGTQAILLRSVDYRDADRIVTLFTLRHGRVAAVARGARSSRRRFAGALEPFALIEVRLGGRPTGLAQLAEAKVLIGHPGILASLARMNEAGGALEDLRDLLPDNTDEPDLFAAAAELLVVLNGCEEGRLSLARYGFVARALALSGLGVDLTCCGLCGRRPGELQPAMFDATHGHLVCRACGGGPLRLGAEARQLIGLGATHGARLCEEASPDGAVLSEMIQALRAVMRAHAAGSH